MSENYLDEVKEILKELNPYKAILFGSYAYGDPNDESDLDLIIVLDKDGFSKNFNEKIENYSSV